MSSRYVCTEGLPTPGLARVLDSSRILAIVDGVVYSLKKYYDQQTIFRGDIPLWRVAGIGESLTIHVRDPTTPTTTPTLNDLSALRDIIIGLKKLTQLKTWDGSFLFAGQKLEIQVPKEAIYLAHLPPPSTAILFFLPSASLIQCVEYGYAEKRYLTFWRPDRLVHLRDAKLEECPDTIMEQYRSLPNHEVVQNEGTYSYYGILKLHVIVAIREYQVACTLEQLGEGFFLPEPHP